jgi:cell division protein FtsB
MLTIILAILLAISVVVIGVLLSERGIDKRVLQRISAKNVQLSEENAKLKKKIEVFRRALSSAARRADMRITQLTTELREERARRRELDRGLTRAGGIIEMLMERDVDDISIDRNQARRLFVV